jgi:hypothetical protein
MRRLVQFLRLAAPDRRLLVEAIAGLVVAGVSLRLFRFARLAARLGTHMAESPLEQDRSAAVEAVRIRWAVETAARHLPWKPMCLPQAVAAQRMLRRRGIPSTLYLGVAPGRGYGAHAWVRAGRVVVTGGPRPDQFAVVSTFA